jgi:hypothetical protein
MALQVPGLAAMRLPVEVRHVEGATGPPAVVGLFGVAQPQIENAKHTAANVRGVM